MSDLIISCPSSLLAFIQEHFGYSSSKAKTLLQQGRCRLNGKIERFGSTKLISGDRLNLQEPIPHAQHEVLYETLYEDSEVIAFNKPPFISSEEFAKQSPAYLLVHRLDKDTTGVLLFAKKKSVLEKLKKQFQAFEVKKSYVALVEGETKSSFFIENHLLAMPYLGGKKMIEDKKGLYAKTLFQKHSTLQGKTLLLCYPITGRTHQIRVHLQSAGHPLIGEPLYAPSPSKSLCRHLLHAYSLSFISENHRQEVIAPLPQDFQSYIQSINENFNYKNIRTR